MKVKLIIFTVLAVFICAALCEKVKDASTEDFCVTCIGANYTVCETPTDKWHCNNNITDCLAKNYPVRTNLWDKCIKNATRFGKDVMIPDPQCWYQYLLTKDYFGRWEARTFDIVLQQNQACGI